MLSRIQLHELVFSSNVPHSLKTITNYGSLCTCLDYCWGVIGIILYYFKRSVKPFIINYSFIIKTTPKNEMQDAVIFWLFFKFLSFFKIYLLLLIKHLPISMLCLKSSWEDAFFHLCCFDFFTLICVEY